VQKFDSHQKDLIAAKKEKLTGMSAD
jgi:hypothetical protein